MNVESIECMVSNFGGGIKTCLKLILSNPMFTAHEQGVESGLHPGNGATMFGVCARCLIKRTHEKYFDFWCAILFSQNAEECYAASDLKIAFLP